MISLVIINGWIIILIILGAGFAFWSFIFSLFSKDKNKNVVKDTASGCLAGILSGAIGIIVLIAIIALIGYAIIYFFTYGFAQLL